jgi:carboxylesterase
MTKRDYSLLLDGKGLRQEIGVLLLHGLGGTPLELKAVARGLASRGFTVSCCQLAGHCGTEEDLLATGWADWFASAECALSELEQRCHTVVIGGLSIGAILALRIAALHPNRIDGLALFAPTLWYDGFAMPWYRFLLRAAFQTHLFDRLRLRERSPYGIKDETIRSVVASALLSGKSAEVGLTCTPLGAMREADRLVRDVKRRLASIKTPTLLIHPREDDISDLSNSQMLQRRLGGQVECLVLDDSYHIVTVDRQRDVVIERTADFIASIERRRSGRSVHPIAPASMVAAG